MTRPITTVTIGTDKYRTQISSGEHTFFADEPGTLGGTDTAPDPYQLLLGAVGACKAITVRMYADRKGWDLQEIRLDLEHSRPDGRGNPERIDVSLSFTGDLTDEQRERLHVIADKCPVQQTITNELSVHSIVE